MRYNICPNCGGSLDPNERCDCTDRTNDLIIPQKGGNTDVNRRKAEGTSVSPGSTNGGGICEPRHSGD